MRLAAADSSIVRRKSCAGREVIAHPAGPQRKVYSVERNCRYRNLIATESRSLVTAIAERFILRFSTPAKRETLALPGDPAASGVDRYFAGQEQGPIGERLDLQSAAFALNPRACFADRPVVLEP